MFKFTAHLKNGTTEEIEGLTPLSAWKQSGHEGSPVGVVDYFSEILSDKEIQPRKLSKEKKEDATSPDTQ